ncbi:Hypothetical protein CINCED_3A009747 [Cinara cedri]|uniref:Uncharacterized protein n=1 Tax=Cinara cedri TaxID=506608 RepID=A0A5E4NKW5_9HEMI|nr:Hypothetical protein CINCED_3A009747 [Cinara cedri]
MVYTIYAREYPTPPPHRITTYTRSLADSRTPPPCRRLDTLSQCASLTLAVQSSRPTITVQLSCRCRRRDPQVRLETRDRELPPIYTSASSHPSNIALPRPSHGRPDRGRRHDRQQKGSKKPTTIIHNTGAKS